MHVHVHALAGTLARETEAAVEGLSEADLLERRRLLEGSYLAETAPEPEIASTSWSQKATSREDGREAQAELPGAVSLPKRRGRSRSADSFATTRPRSTSRRRVHRRTALRRRAGLRRLAVDPLAGTPEAVDARLLRQLQRALAEGHREDRGVLGSGDNLNLYVTSLGNTDILHRDSEIALARMIGKGAAVEEKTPVLQERLGRAPTLDEVVAEQGLLSTAHLQLLLGNAAAARKLLVHHNVRLVISVAKRYTNRGVDTADLVQEGFNGLMRAIDKFNPARGFKFSTYACWWIRQTISRCITERSRVVRLPVHIYDALTRINRVRDELRAHLGEAPSDEQVGALLGLAPERVAAYRSHILPPKSLEQPVFSNGALRDKEPLTWSDKVANEEQDVDDDASQEAALVAEDIKATLSTLPPRERNVVRMRYGLHRPDGQAMSLNDVSVAYGLSKERIRQIEDTALHKLRLPWRRTLALQRAHVARGGADAGWA